jgi:phospholipid/cholesterol/gamma-HCH transport system substrate-binding protein
VRLVSRLVTFGVAFAVLAIVGALIYSKMPETQVGGDFRTFAMFRDGSRLQPGSPVVVAGVRIGDITELSIEGGFARVDMRLQSDVHIPYDSFATRRADSLFGDSYIEIIPGHGGRLLRDGEQLAHVQEGGSTDTVLRAMARAMPKIDNALEQVKEFMVNGRQWVQGPMENRLEAADRWLSEGHIEGPLSLAARAMERTEDRTRRGADVVAARGRDVPSTLADWNQRVTRARATIAETQQGMVDGFRNAREGLDRLDEPVGQMAEVMGAINRGEGEDWKGTLGQLVNEPQLGDDIEDATEGLKEAAAGFSRFKSWLGARLELGASSRQFRFYATAELRARNDKFYLIELERSALGGVPADSLTDVANTNAYTRRQEIRDKLRFTFQFGKQIRFMQFRAGLKDSTFGIGTDMLLLEGRLRLSADVFGSFTRTPRVKLAGAFAVFRSIYVLAGVDDALNEPGELEIVTGNTNVPQWFDRLTYGRDYFVGAALQFDDADLATLLRVYGALLVGLL